MEGCLRLHLMPSWMPEYCLIAVRRMLHHSRTQEMPTDGASPYSIIYLITRPKLPFFFLSALPPKLPVRSKGNDRRFSSFSISWQITCYDSLMRNCERR